MSRILVSLGGNALGTDFDELQVVPGVRLARCAGLGQRHRGLLVARPATVDRNTIENRPHARGLHRTVCTVISRALVDAGHVVIEGGGAGIPTVCKDNWHKAIDAVIDKDHVSVMTAADARCDAMAILTGVEKVAVNHNAAEQQDLDDLTVAHAEKYLAESQVPEGSMPPKIRTASRFTTSGPGRKTLMTSLDKLVEGLKGQTGTWIVP